MDGLGLQQSGARSAERRSSQAHNQLYRARPEHEPPREHGSARSGASDSAAESVAPTQLRTNPLQQHEMKLMRHVVLPAALLLAPALAGHSASAQGAASGVGPTSQQGGYIFLGNAR